MKEHQHTPSKEECAQKIQAVYRGYSIRKHFLAVRLRYERIVKSIEGTTEVNWNSMYLCYPVFQDSSLLLKLNELNNKKSALIQELEDLEQAIKERKEFLRSK